MAKDVYELFRIKIFRLQKIHMDNKIKINKKI